MKLLLDENFPLQLYHRLRHAGQEVEHLVVSGERGLPDAAIRERLRLEEDLVFLTQDTEFEHLAEATRGVVIISRIPQSLPIQERVELWLQALVPFLEDPAPGSLFDLLPTGHITPIELR